MNPPQPQNPLPMSLSEELEVRLQALLKLRRQMLEASVDAHNRVEALLTKEQKDQLRSYRRGWMLGND